MVDVKNAVTAAVNAAGLLYSGKDIIGLQLEEVEKSEDGKYWFITLGFSVPDEIPPAKLPAITAAIFPEKKYERKYKVFKIDADSAEFISMKIREV